MTISADRPTPDIEELLSQAHPPKVDIRREFAAVPESVRAARQLVGTVLQGQTSDHELYDDVILAVSEAVTNAVTHAYDDPRGPIQLTVQRSSARLVITVSDLGRGLGSPAPTPGLGLGIGLIKRVAEHASFIANRHGGTTVEMRFSLSARPLSGSCR